MKRLSMFQRFVCASVVLWVGAHPCCISSVLAQAIAPQSVAFQKYEVLGGRLVQELAAINSDGTAEQQILLNLPEVGFPTWSRDGQSLALASVNPSTPFTFSRNVFVVNFQTREIHRVTDFRDQAKTQTDGGGSKTLTACTFPWFKAFSPEKSRIAVAVWEYTGISWGYTETNMDNPPPRDLLTGFKCTPLLQVYQDNGTPGALVTVCGLGTDTIHAGEGVDWAPNQELLVYPKDIQMLVTDVYGQSAYLPATALFTMAPVDDAVNRGQAQQITSPNIWMIETMYGPAILWQTDFQPAFSPDGRQVAYIRSLMAMRMGPLLESHSLRLVNVDGTADHEIIAFDQGRYTSHLSWSPDGRKLVFDQGNQALGNSGLPLPMIDIGSSGLYTINIDGTDLKQIRAPAAAWPAWYPKTGNPVLARLEIKPAPAAPGRLVFSWPAAAGNFVLQSSPTLGANALWKDEPTQPTTVQDLVTVTLNSKGTVNFYRLIQH